MIERKNIRISNQYMSTFGITLEHMCNSCDGTVHTNNIVRFRVIHPHPISEDEIISFRGYKEILIWLDSKYAEYVLLKTGQCGELNIISDSLFNIPINDKNIISMEDLATSSFEDVERTRTHHANELVLSNGKQLFSSYPEECTNCDSTDELSDGYITIMTPTFMSKCYERSIEIEDNYRCLSIGDVSIYMDALPAGVDDIVSYDVFNSMPSIDFAKNKGLGGGFKNGVHYYKDDFVRKYE